MISFLKGRSKLPGIDAFALASYQLNFSMESIQPGVDNVRHDVRLSPAFCELAGKIIPQLIVRHIRLDQFFKIEKAEIWTKNISEFKRLYRLMMDDAIHKSKLDNNPEIDFLAQIAVIKFIIADIRSHFEHTANQVKNIIRKHASIRFQDLDDSARTKETLSSILQNRDDFLRNVGRDLFEILADVDQNELRTIREANFGEERLLPADILQNPIFHTPNPFHDVFLIDVYDVIFGRRIEDPDNYDSLIGLLEKLFHKLNEQRLELGQAEQNLVEEPATNDAEASRDDFDPGRFIKQIENIDKLLNCYQTREEINKLKKKKAPANVLSSQKALLRKQKVVLAEFYRTFKKAKLINRIAAGYEMRSVYKAYCPPLVPQQILLFMIDPRSRRAVVKRLKQLKKLYHQRFSLGPLKKQIKKLEFLQAGQKKRYLIRFLNGIVRYHRDIENFKTLNEAMDGISLTDDEQILILSRANHTLYEFLLPNEKEEDERPIINHVVIKADVRGSTDITHQMNKRGLNPASYFSLNFFNPISETLKDYGAVKVFIEGDAIILAIFEREKTPEGWYSVARACGMAINMLLIIKRYNEKSRKHELPILEIGIGVNFQKSPPTFLFDGTQRIMISSAINLADRQSSCSKSMRRLLRAKKSPFNLYVYQPATDEEVDQTSDDIFLRYNVNGIELNDEGFKKLSEEINLTSFELEAPDDQQAGTRMYTGKFPLTSGRFQRLIIREGVIPQIDSETFRTIKKTGRTYYEICTHPKIYQYVRNMSR